jgi:hypothetical protein
LVKFERISVEHRSSAGSPCANFLHKPRPPGRLF